MNPGLVIRAQQGDEAAFAELTVAVSGRLLRIAYGILRDRGLAEDATQQAQSAVAIETSVDTDLVLGVTLVTEEIEPGVSRVLAGCIAGTGRVYRGY